MKDGTAETQPSKLVFVLKEAWLHKGLCSKTMSCLAYYVVFSGPFVSALRWCSCWCLAFLSCVAIALRCDCVAMRLRCNAIALQCDCVARSVHKEAGQGSNTIRLHDVGPGALYLFSHELAM